MNRGFVMPKDPEYGALSVPAIPSAFALRVLDARARLRSGETRQEIRERHGGVVLAEALSQLERERKRDAAETA